MNTFIEVEVKNVYGNELVYPLNEQARLLCKLAGKKTFTTEMIATCQALGFEFKDARNEVIF